MTQDSELIFPARMRWDPKQTAVVVCDMWKKHWCSNATRRAAEMAPRMNEVVSTLRTRGILIIHSPTKGMAHYEQTPMRAMAKRAPVIVTPAPIELWNPVNTLCEPSLPIDDSDGGCDCTQKWGWREEGRSYLQIETIAIEESDAVAENAEVYYLMRERGIKNVILMGIHTNMCVLSRSFGIRQMIYLGMYVVLMRDMTDIMYDPRMPPHVSHFRGTDLVIEHIERYWCPTVTSADIIDGKPFCFAADTGE